MNLDELYFKAFKGGKSYIGRLCVLDIDYGPVKAGCYISNRYGTAFAYKVEPETICRPTGVLINNQLIWEKDVLLVKEFHWTGYENKPNTFNKEPEPKYEDYIAEVKFEDGCFFVGDYPLHVVAIQTVEILGNTVLNPELLSN